MTKSFLITIGVILLAIGGGIWWFFENERIAHLSPERPRSVQDDLKRLKHYYPYEMKTLNVSRREIPDLIINAVSVEDNYLPDRIKSMEPKRREKLQSTIEQSWQKSRPIMLRIAKSQQLPAGCQLDITQYYQKSTKEWHERLDLAINLPKGGGFNLPLKDKPQRT
jgi:hypothetical protein